MIITKEYYPPVKITDNEGNIKFQYKGAVSSEGNSFDESTKFTISDNQRNIKIQYNNGNLFVGDSSSTVASHVTVWADSGLCSPHPEGGTGSIGNEECEIQYLDEDTEYAMSIIEDMEYPLALFEWSKEMDKKYRQELWDTRDLSLQSIRELSLKYPDFLECTWLDAGRMLEYLNDVIGTQ
ncbi:hypothetical protein MKY95_10040 [Paenibacillus sp. FSL P4-0176]|uniref:hypothetical protein n=1 Tax=Paenibacillus sp. FSL P4-0176 TaxID=2921631 RepID=UPI0030CEAA4E